jgi:hypothetical protein
LELQEVVLSELLYRAGYVRDAAEKLASLWVTLIRGEDWVHYDRKVDWWDTCLLMPDGRKVFPNMPLCTARRYKVGQPMGAYSSWAMFAVTHHFIVQKCAMEAGSSIW